MIAIRGHCTVIVNGSVAVLPFRSRAVTVTLCVPGVDGTLPLMVLLRPVPDGIVNARRCAGHRNCYRIASPGRTRRSREALIHVYCHIRDLIDTKRLAGWRAAGWTVGLGVAITLAESP